MKKLFLFICVFVSLSNFSQKTIIEEKFEKDNEPLSFHILPYFNQIIIDKGKIPGMSWKRNIKTSTRYDSDGSKKVLIQNGNQMDLVTYSYDNNTFKASEFASMKWTNDYKIYSNNFVSSIIDKKLEFSYFNNQYIFNVGDIKEENVHNLFEEDLYLFKTDIKTLKTEKIKLEIPFKNINIKDYYKLKKLDFKSRFYKDYFEIVTKLIKPNCKSFVLNRVLFDFNGKMISKMMYDIDLENSIIQSYNGGGIVTTSGMFSADKLAFNTENEFNVVSMMEGFVNQLSINNTVTDANQNFYIYGLYGEKEEKSIDSKPRGYYIFKYNKEGKLLWKKTEDVVNKDFNKYSSLSNLNLKLFLRADKLDLVIFTSKLEDLLIYKEFNSENSIVLNDKTIPFEEEGISASSVQNDFLLAFFHLDEWKKIRCNPMTLVFYDTNTKLKNYIDSFKPKKEKTFFNTYAFEKGLWLIESDNKTYYKVSYFEN